MKSQKPMWRPRSAGASGYSSWPRCNGYTGVTSNQSPHSSETMMRFYNQQHRFYCGIDLHARTLAVCILDAAGAIAFRGNVAASPQAVRDALAPFREDVAVACACLFAWYWLADLCQEEKVPFVLGHALYRKAIHGGKAKNDPIDAEKIARLLRGGNLPVAYVYPRPCAPPATSCAAAPSWCTSGPSCSPTWSTPTASTTCRRWPRSSPTPPTARSWTSPAASATPASAAAPRPTWRCSTPTTSRSAPWSCT